MFVKHAEEIAEYIKSKYPDIPVHARQDISAFAACRTAVVANDILREHIESTRGVFDKYLMTPTTIRKDFNNDEGTSKT